MTRSDRLRSRRNRWSVTPTPPRQPPRRAPKDETQSPSRDISAGLKRVARQISDVVHRASQLEELADSVLAELHDLGTQCPGGSGMGARTDLREIRRIKRDLDEQRRYIAASGTDDFLVKEMADGGATVQIDGKKTRLSATLAALLAILAADGGQPSDDLVPWKSMPEIAAQLSVRLGRDMRLGALRQNISRLRSGLDAGGIDRFLVQTQGSRARFALRRRESPDALPVRKA